jgi:RNA polymerase sigma-70 factor (ECF subfamily)
MSESGKLASGQEPSRALDSVRLNLYRKAEAEKHGLTLEDFARILQEVGAKYLPVDASEDEAWELFAGLRVEELALARACAKGNESAWDVFLNKYREKLYDAARSITREESSARDLADSLYADLFGTHTSGSQRISKLSSYTGRGSLEGWLRAVLAQEYVNRYRKEKRLVSLEEQTEAGVQFQAEASGPAPALDARLEAATDEALVSLSGEEKFVLACYYLDGRTLAEIARILGVHESTVSRRVERITASTRKRIINGLVRRGMSRGEAEEAVLADVRDFSLNVRERLMQEKGQQTVP